MADLSLDTQGFFPQRGRQWRAWEDEFLKTFAAEFGLVVSADTLRRPPQDVALRISWLGVKMPADKVQAAPAPKEAPRLKEIPSAWARSRAQAPDGWKTCAQVAEMAGCAVNRVYSAIWKKRLDALQGDRGVWLVPDEAAEEFVHSLKPEPEDKTPVEASERPVEARKEVPAVVLRERQSDAPERRLGAENGKAESFIPAEPLPDEPPAEARRHAVHEAVPVEGPSPQAMDLASMSRLDILRAFARGEAVGGIRA